MKFRRWCVCSCACSCLHHRTKKACILFIDEVDAIGGSRGGDEGNSDSEAVGWQEQEWNSFEIFESLILILRKGEDNSIWWFDALGIHPLHYGATECCSAVTESQLNVIDWWTRCSGQCLRLSTSWTALTPAAMLRRCPCVPDPTVKFNSADELVIWCSFFMFFSCSQCGHYTDEEPCSRVILIEKTWVQSCISLGWGFVSTQNLDTASKSFSLIERWVKRMRGQWLTLAHEPPHRRYTTFF